MNFIVQRGRQYYKFNSTNFSSLRDTNKAFSLHFGDADVKKPHANARRRHIGNLYEKLFFFSPICQLAGEPSRVKEPLSFPFQLRNPSNRFGFSSSRPRSSVRWLLQRIGEISYSSGDTFRRGDRRCKANKHPNHSDESRNMNFWWANACARWRWWGYFFLGNRVVIRLPHNLSFVISITDHEH